MFSHTFSVVSRKGDERLALKSAEGGPARDRPARDRRRWKKRTAKEKGRGAERPLKRFGREAAGGAANRGRGAARPPEHSYRCNRLLKQAANIKILGNYKYG